MELILMRHGRAESLSSRITDSQRELTQTGRRRVQEAAIGLARSRLIDLHNVMIWSSPLLRALQTAQILADAWGGLAVAEYEAVARGDLETLAAGWTVVSPGYSLVIVGHEPYLSSWAERIAGVYLPFKRASAAGFSIRDIPSGKGKLRWYITGKTLAHIAAADLVQTGIQS